MSVMTGAISARRYIYHSARIERGMENLCGAKAVNNALIKHVLDLRVPAFFVISSEAVWRFLRHHSFPGALFYDLRKAMEGMEAETGRKFGQGLSVSVRAAGPRFMSGILRTILNVGRSGSGPLKQLRTAISEVALSWDKAYAKVYRRSHGYEDYPCQAIIVQQMIHGDLNENSASGVYFSRDPVTGESESGSVAVRASGDAVMSAVRRRMTFAEYKELYPHPAGRVIGAGELVEDFFGDAQELEFTVQDGHAYYLQTRSPDRSPEAAYRIAIALAAEGLVSNARAASLVLPEHEAALLADRLDREVVRPDQLLIEGRGVAPGIATGRIALTNQAAVQRPGSILIKEAVIPQDYRAINSSRGVISYKDELGMHTRSLALGLRIPAIANAPGLMVDPVNDRLVVRTGQGEVVLTEEDVITIDGHDGRIYRGAVGVKRSRTAELVERLGRFIVPLDRLSYITSGPEPEELLARGVHKVRAWWKLPKDAVAGLHLSWPEISRLIEATPEVKDYPRSVHIAAFDLLRRGSFTMDDILAEIDRREETEPGQWEDKPLSKHAYSTTAEAGEFDHVFLRARGRQLMLALYYLDKVVPKRICTALCFTCAGIHTDTRNALTGMSPDQAVLLLDGMIEAANHDALKASDHFFVFAVSSLAIDRDHDGILNRLKPTTLAFFLDDYYAYEVLGAKTTSDSVSIGMTRLAKLLPIIGAVGKDRLRQAIELINDPQTREFWLEQIG